jgi:hypothetical protein
VSSSLSPSLMRRSLNVWFSAFLIFAVVLLAIYGNSSFKSWSFPEINAFTADTGAPDIALSPLINCHPKTPTINLTSALIPYSDLISATF